MFYEVLRSKEKQNELPQASVFTLRQIHTYLGDFLQQLDAKIDVRLVRTFFDVMVAILVNRNQKMSLLLSELGGYIAGFDHAPAGTKRISNLLRCKKWTHHLIDTFLFGQGCERIHELNQQGKRALILWDDSVVEKHESWLVQGLCSVFSSKGKRLTRIKRGYYRPPVSRINVPGYEWRAAVVSHLGGVPQVLAMKWWTRRGKFKDSGAGNTLFRTLKQLHKTVGRLSLHVLDRGFVSVHTLELFAQFKQDLLLRWKGGVYLTHEEKGRKLTHLLARSFKAKARAVVRDKERKTTRHVSIAWAKVTRQEIDNQDYTLLIIRDVTGKSSPIYLLTSLDITDARTAWEMCFSYMHRWEIEQSFRFMKSELGLESARLWFFENRLKLMAMVSLVYDFILRLLRCFPGVCAMLLRRFCHRTGSRYRSASIPAYRLRAALEKAILTIIFQKSPG